MIYLDNGATTFPKPASVINAVKSTLAAKGANPGRSGHRMSIAAAEIVYNCRENVSRLFGAKSPENVIFFNNCTSALNTVIKGILKKGDHAVISSLEHNAVVRPLEELKKRGVNYSIAEYVPYDNEATIDNFRNAFNEKTKLVICTGASNVFGFKLPVERIGALCRIYGILFCVDAAQTAGIVPIDLNNSCIDYLCTAGHKGLYGPMGTGLLIINNDIIPDSLIQGGTGSMSSNMSQPEILPDKFESGTVNLIGIAGLNEGIKFVMRRTTDSIEKYETRLIQTLYDNLNKNRNVVLYTRRPDISDSVPVLSFNIDGYDSEKTAMLLNDRFDIAVRAGLHCAPLAHKQFSTLETGTVRIAVSAFTTIPQIAYVSNCINKIAKFKK